MKSQSNSRLPYVDFLKFIGLTGIIIAHVGSPKWAMMIRSFDVPLMVILSSLLANKSFNNYICNGKSLKNYYISRIERLVFPTWIFLVLYFVIRFIISGNAERLNYYITSFALTRYGVGYVWIILIYLYSALLIPLFAKIKTSKMGLFGIISVYLVYEIAFHYRVGLDGNAVIRYFVDVFFYYIIPYGLLTYLGYNYSSYKKKTKILIIVCSSFLFIVFAVYYAIKNGNFQLVQIAKYPPRVYYLSYGVACSFSFLFYCERKSLKIYNNPAINFISSHSMWIYLWHILFLDVYDYWHLPNIWYVKLLIVYSAACVMVIAVNTILNQIERKHSIAITKYLRR